MRKYSMNSHCPVCGSVVVIIQDKDKKVKHGTEQCAKMLRVKLTARQLLQQQSKKRRSFGKKFAKHI